MQPQHFLLLPIDDGFRMDGVIKAKGGFQELKFSFRPATSLEVRALRAASTSDPVANEKLTVEFLANHLTAWDARSIDPATNQVVAVPISLNNLARVPFLYQEAMVDWVCGYAEAPPFEVLQKN